MSTSDTILIRTQLDDTLAVTAVDACAVTLNCPEQVVVTDALIAESLSLTRVADEDVDEVTLVDADATFNRTPSTVTVEVA